MSENKNEKAKISKAWIIVAIFVIVTAVILVVSINSKNPILPTSPFKETQQSVAHTTLEFSNNPRVGSGSAAFEMDININSNQDKVTLTQIELSYNPKLIDIIDIKPGNFIKNPDVLQKSIDPVNGRVKYWLAVAPNQKGISGKGVIATISFLKSGSSAAQINFLPKTSVSGDGTDQPILKSMVSGVVSILPYNFYRMPIVSPTKNP